MKERILCSLKNISFVIIIALLGTACGDDKEESINVGNEGGNGTVIGTVAKVDVKKAGSLSSLIGDDVKFNITDLTVTGDINGDDIALIREMAGADVNGDETKGHLSKLNLKDANIVAGGNPYYINTGIFYSKRDVVGSYMFSNCDKLTSVILPNSVIEIGSYIFNEIINTESHSIAEENATLTSIVIGNKTAIIGNYAFYACTGLTEINMPNSVNEIGDYVFWQCNNLVRIDLASVSKMEISAFWGCDKLVEFVVSEDNSNYSSLGGVLFNKDKSILIIYPKARPNQSYIIPNSVITVEDNAFDNAYLTSITIGDKVSQMKFSNVGTHLKEYIVTNNNANYLSLDGVLFNKNKTELIAYPIDKISSNYIVPSSVTKISDSVKFSLNLSTLNLNNVTEIQEPTIFGTYVKEFIVSATNPRYSTKDNVLFNKEQTSLIAYPMAAIKEYKPNGRGSSYIIPNGVTNISAYAFYPVANFLLPPFPDWEFYPLETLTIPVGVERIGACAIYGAKNIHCKSETPPYLDYAQHYPLTNMYNVYVPLSAINTYKQAVGWREANIIGE